eukprot:1775285-Pyramimonas_sp.AAC.1
MTFINYRPFTKAGPARPTTAQPSGGGKGHAPAAEPHGGAGQDKDGDDHSTAPSTEILSALADAIRDQSEKPPPGGPGAPGPLGGGGGRGGPQGPGGSNDLGGLDE